jgi:hypothetical protein
VKTLLKQTLMRGYCSGWMPAWAVTVMFKVFRLKSL